MEGVATGEADTVPGLLHREEADAADRVRAIAGVHVLPIRVAIVVFRSWGSLLLLLKLDYTHEAVSGNCSAGQFSPQNQEAEAGDLSLSLHVH